jgi:prepilin-type N-terminal cleavage/methylation domain-containing protein
MQYSKANPRGTRAGFTLVELLVVITIIVILVALSTAGIVRYISVQEVSNTRTILTKLDPIVKAQYNTLTQLAFKETIPAVALVSVQNIAGAAATDVKRQRAVYVKMRQMQAFPINFNEVFNNPLGPLPQFKQVLLGYGITTGTTPAAPWESSVCLLIALQAGYGGTGFKPDDLGVSAVQNVGPGIPGLVDYWGKPLHFFRWPIGDQTLNPSGVTPAILQAQPGAGNDPADPEGTFTFGSWLASASANNFKTTFGYAAPARAKAPFTAGPLSYNLVPIVVSEGPDHAYAFDLTTALPGGTQDNDNLSTVNQ